MRTASGCSSLAWRKKSSPSTSGMRRSEMTASYATSRRLPNAFSGLSKPCTRQRESSKSDGIRSIARRIALMMGGWSSRTRMLYMAAFSSRKSGRGKRLLDGKGDLKQRALGQGRAHRNVTAVLLDDAKGDGQSEASAATHALGGEEGFENVAKNVLIHPAPVVADVNLHSIRVELARGDLDASVRTHGLCRVDKYVHEHLAQLGRIALDQRQRLEVGNEAEVFAGQASHEVEGRGEGAMHVEQLKGFCCITTREVAQVLHNLANPVHAFAGFFQQGRQILDDHGEIDSLLARLHGARAFLGTHACVAQKVIAQLQQPEQLVEVVAKSAHVGLHVADRIVDLVRHARCELSDRRQFVGLEHPVLLRGQGVRGFGRSGMEIEPVGITGARRANGHAEQARGAASAPLTHHTQGQPVHAIAIQAVFATFTWWFRVRTQPWRIRDQLGEAEVQVVMYHGSQSAGRRIGVIERSVVTQQRYRQG